MPRARCTLSPLYFFHFNSAEHHVYLVLKKLLAEEWLYFAHCSGPGSAEPKRGPGRPPVRLSTQPSLGGRTSKRKGGLGGAAVGTGTTPYGTNELVGRKIWCALAFSF